MSLLAFLTGLSGGAEEAISADRAAIQKEQNDELQYRRANLEHMVKAAEEGRVNPTMVSRVFQEYMDSMQGLSGKPSAGGKAGFRGKKDLGQQNLLNDLVTGAAQMFGPQPKAMTIHTGPESQELPGREPQALTPLPGMEAGPEMPSGMNAPTMLEQDPLAQLVRGSAANLDVGQGGNWLYQHPEMIKAQNAHAALQGDIAEKKAAADIDASKQERLYRSGGAFNYKVDAAEKGAATAAQNAATRAKSAAGSARVLSTDDQGNVSVIDKLLGGAVGNIPGAGKSKTIPQPRQAPIARLDPASVEAKASARALYADYNNFRKEYLKDSMPVPGTPEAQAADDYAWSQVKDSAAAAGLSSIQALRERAFVPLSQNTNRTPGPEAGGDQEPTDQEYYDGVKKWAARKGRPVPTNAEIAQWLSNAAWKTEVRNAIIASRQKK